MPYIRPDLRPAIDESSKELVDLLRGLDPVFSAGATNYAITMLLHRLYTINNYKSFNEIMGILESVKQEFYRRRIAAYEDAKKEENGDIDW